MLRQELDRQGSRARLWLLGIQRHKDGATMLRALLGPADQALIVPIPDHHAWSVEELAAACPELADRLTPAQDLEAGLRQLTGAATGGTDRDQALPVVAGSLYVLGGVIPLLDPLQAAAPAHTAAPIVLGES